LEKFGLDALLVQKGSALDAEILKERVSALGATGRRLTQLLDEHRDNMQQGRSAAVLGDSVSKIADCLSALMIQRELMGLPHENIEWILRAFDIPEAVVVKLGLRSGA
jgi:hypothetical protein